MLLFGVAPVLLRFTVPLRFVVCELLDLCLMGGHKDVEEFIDLYIGFGVAGCSCDGCSGWVGGSSVFYLLGSGCMVIQGVPLYFES